MDVIQWSRNIVGGHCTGFSVVYSKSWPWLGFLRSRVMVQTSVTRFKGEEIETEEQKVHLPFNDTTDTCESMFAQEVFWFLVSFVDSSRRARPVVLFLVISADSPPPVILSIGVLCTLPWSSRPSSLHYECIGSTMYDGRVYVKDIRDIHDQTSSFE